MTVDHSGTEETWLELEVEMVTAQLRDLQKEMFQMQKRVRDGDMAAAKDAQKTLVEVRGFLRSASETEARLAEFRRREGGGDGAFVLDLDGARASVRCRLDRLRRCHGAG